MSTPTVEDILFHCAQHFGVEVENIINHNRKRKIAYARHCACWFIKREFPDATLHDIAKEIGNRDHTTIINSLRAVQDLLDTNRLFAKGFIELTVKIDSGKPLNEKFEDIEEILP